MNKAQCNSLTRTRFEKFANVRHYTETNAFQSGDTHAFIGLVRVNLVRFIWILRLHFRSLQHFTTLIHTITNEQSPVQFINAYTI